MFELIFTQKRKHGFFSTSFAVILLTVALPIVLKAEFNFERHRSQWVKGHGKSIDKLTSVFHASVLLWIMTFVITFQYN